MEYAEGLVQSTARLNPNVAAHVTQCAKCRKEVNAVCLSIMVVNGVDNIEPSTQFTQDVLRAARSIPRERRSTFAILRTATMAASLAAFAAIVPAYVMQSDMNLPAIPEVSQSVVRSTTTVTPSAYVEPETREETLLVPAVMSDHHEPDTAWERAQHRALNAYDDDIAEAEMALSNNPALTRASVLISQTRARKARTLKDVYTEGQ